MAFFSFPDNLDNLSIGELENHIIDICNSCTNYEDILAASTPVWDWVCQILNKSPQIIRSEIESHETDEQFPTPYLEERDHLLKLPLLLLETVNKPSI